MTRRTPLYALCSALLLLACGGDPATAKTASDSSTAATATQTSASGEDGAGSGDNGAPAAKPGTGSAAANDGGTRNTGPNTSSLSPAPAPSKPVLAATSDPPGTQPLSEAEEKELEGQCKGFLAHLKKVAAKDNSSRARLERLQQILKNPPTIAGTDVPRCAGLLKRALIVYRARTMETEAINSLKRIVLGLSMAMSDAQPRLCPSAGPVPAQLETLKGGSKPVPMSAWQRPGWQCVRFDMQGMPQFFQYELRTNKSAGSYEIMARGFPVEGHGPVELFMAGEVNNGAIQPSSDVYRRAVTR